MAVAVALPLLLGAVWNGVSGAVSEAPVAPPGATESDDALLSALGCGGCHAGLPEPVGARAAAPPLGPGAPPLPVDFVFSYLADPVTRRTEIAPSRMPDFRLSTAERAALALFLGQGAPGPELSRAVSGSPEVDAGSGRQLFLELGCGACHTHPDVPREGAVAPSLEGVAQRLRAEWIRGWLEDPTPVRPAFLGGARMPDFRLESDELDRIVLALAGGGGSGTGAAPEPAWMTEGVPAVRSARAERLLETRYGCRGCHLVAGRGGSLGPPLEGLAERLQPDFVLRMILDPASAAPGSAMPRQPIPSRDAEILAAYLLRSEAPWAPAVDGPGRRPAVLGGAAVGPGRDDAPAASPAVEGATLYARWCAACHGPGGGGDGWNAEALSVDPTVHADAAVPSTRPDDVVYDGIHGGGWVLGRSPLMPAFGEFLSPAQIDALVAHIRTLCDCVGPPWSRDGGGER